MRVVWFRTEKREPRTRVKGYRARRIVSRGVGSQGEAWVGGGWRVVVGLEGELGLSPLEGIPFTRRVAMTVVGRWNICCTLVACTLICVV